VLETGQAEAVFIRSVAQCARGNVDVDLSAFRGQGCAAGCGVRGVLREARRGDATLVSKIVFHVKGARRASICSWMSGDIGVGAVDPAEHVRGQELVMVGGEMRWSDSIYCCF
jgi:hypothetical protein